jgi:hypothetical protein
LDVPLAKALYKNLPAENAQAETQLSFVVPVEEKE